MKHLLLTATTLALALGASNAYADDDCYDAVANWQPQETLRQMLEAKAWQVNRIKVDDGCYEVKGLDKAGNRIEAQFSPASLQVRSFEVDFAEGADISGYPMLPAPVSGLAAPVAAAPIQPAVPVAAPAPAVPALPATAPTQP
ncbi:PepSY domain-containing protein [Oceanisphaera sp. W20_SRM_FM3]|uniref:PepSY domain-containing protein n=1 Tax=Oceanisphaera sp. W20_SRM_FM3 TaxID=3240267 RepID=UPI003F99E6B1